MQLTLTLEEAVTLRELLTSYLSELRMEIARTEAKDFRGMLRERERLAERLVEDLDRAAT